MPAGDGEGDRLHLGEIQIVPGGNPLPDLVELGGRELGLDTGADLGVVVGGAARAQAKPDIGLHQIRLDDIAAAVRTATEPSDGRENQVAGNRWLTDPIVGPGIDTFYEADSSSYDRMRSTIAGWMSDHGRPVQSISGCFEPDDRE